MCEPTIRGFDLGTVIMLAVVPFWISAALEVGMYAPSGLKLVFRTLTVRRYWLQVSSSQIVEIEHVETKPRRDPSKPHPEQTLHTIANR